LKNPDEVKALSLVGKPNPRTLLHWSRMTSWLMY